MKKKYRIKITPALRKKLKRWHKEYMEEDDTHWGIIKVLQRKMAKDTGIKDIGFIVFDGELAGIGNESRTMPLVDFNGGEIWD